MDQKQIGRINELARKARTPEGLTEWERKEQAAQRRGEQRELLARLKAEGARMCICSNTWSDQCKAVLTRLGLDDHFEFYIEAQGPLHKSRPDVFFEALHSLGGTDPRTCAVREDSLYTARTAHDAGFYVIVIADAASAADEPALRQVSDQFLQEWGELKL